MTAPVDHSPAADALPWAWVETPLGPCALAWTSRGIAAIQLPEADRGATRARLERALRGRALAPAATEPTGPAAIAAAAIARHLRGQPGELDRLPIDWDGVPPFARRVYEAARAVPAGKTATYGDLAARAGTPGAARAVGQALGKNPFPVVIPCHRVLAKSGAGGFSAAGGLSTKARILAVEGVSLEAEAALPYDAPAACRHLAKADPQLGAWIRRIGRFGLQLEPTATTLAALAEAIVYQQLTGKAAATIFGRVRALFPKARLTADAIAGTSIARLRTAGLSQAKALALKDLADKARARAVPPIPRLHAMDDDAIVEQLSAVRGVGRWTVEMLLIFRLGRPDVLPVGDYGVRKGFARLYGGELPTPRALSDHGERWRPFRSVASWYLWRAAEASPTAHPDLLTSPRAGE